MYCMHLSSALLPCTSLHYTHVHMRLLQVMRRRSSSRECFACTMGLGSVHRGIIACAKSQLGMNMWVVIQLARLHHWSTVSLLLQLGGRRALAVVGASTASHSHWLAVGSHLLACMPSDAGVQQQTARPGRKKGRIGLPLILPWLQLPALPCLALIALAVLFTRC